jgi:hypothetical protein
MRNVGEKKKVGVTEQIEYLGKVGKVDPLPRPGTGITIAAAAICRYSEQWFCF